MENANTKEFRIDKGMVEFFLGLRQWAKVCYAFHLHFDGIIKTDREWFVGKNGIIFVFPESAWCKLLFKHNYSDIDENHKRILKQYILRETNNKSSDEKLCQKDLDYLDRKLGYTNRSITKDGDVMERIGYPTGKKYKIIRIFT